MIVDTVRRVGASPRGFVTAIVGLTSAGLLLDHWAALWFQYVLAAGCWGLLTLSLCFFTPHERAQTLCLVAVASCFEVIGSIVWGLYRYRLGNLPLFVPPGHGLVYLTGLQLSRTAWAREHAREFVRIAAGGALLWGVVGLTGVLGRVDAFGAVGVVCVLAVLRWGRAPAAFAGVFFFVAFLEVYGTALGTWRWAETVPGLGLPDGNPPSGAASGYVVFDVCALFLAPHLLRLVARVRGRPVATDDGPVAAPVASLQTARLQE